MHRTLEISKIYSNLYAVQFNLVYRLSKASSRGFLGFIIGPVRSRYPIKAVITIMVYSVAVH